MSCVLTSWVGILLLRDRFVSERVDGQAEAQKGVRNRWKGSVSPTYVFRRRGLYKEKSSVTLEIGGFLTVRSSKFWSSL